jgi:hypothetical protein
VSNFFDPAGFFSGGGSGATSQGGSSSGGSSLMGAALLGSGGDKNNDPQVVDTQKAYGFGVAGSGDNAGDSQFNAMRKQQMGMGGPSGG